MNRAPGSLFTVDADGYVRNTYLLKITNKEASADAVSYHVEVDGLEGAVVTTSDLDIAPEAEHDRAAHRAAARRGRGSPDDPVHGRGSRRRPPSCSCPRPSRRGPRRWRRRVSVASPRRGRITLSRDQLWPAIIIVGLALVLVVNAMFIYIAVSGADEVAPSYNAGASGDVARTSRRAGAEPHGGGDAPSASLAVPALRDRRGGPRGRLLLRRLRDGLRHHPRVPASSATTPSARPSPPVPSRSPGGWDALPVEPDEGGLCEIRLAVDGLRCASCVWVAENVLQRTLGVKEATMSYATGRATLRWDPARVRLGELAGRDRGPRVPAPPARRGSEARPGPPHAPGGRGLRGRERDDVRRRPVRGMVRRDGGALRGALPVDVAGAGHAGGAVERRAVLRGRVGRAAERRPAHGRPHRAGGPGPVRAGRGGHAAGRPHVPRLPHDARGAPPGGTGAGVPRPAQGGRSRRDAGGHAAGHGPTGAAGRGGDGGLGRAGGRRPRRMRCGRGAPRRRRRRGRRELRCAWRSSPERRRRWRWGRGSGCGRARSWWTAA